MNVKMDAPKIHNRFDIYINGEQVAYAENIILNQMWTKLTSRVEFFRYIHYGTGTGTLAASRTALFNRIGDKFCVDVETVRAYPTSYRRRKIELGLTEHNGSTLTEVGIADNSGNGLVTHAMLRDMNGNPVSILKTNVDILTIYATLYVVLDNSHPQLKLINPATNSLLSYLLGSGFPGAAVTAGMCGAAADMPSGLLSTSIGSASTAGSFTGDAANKRVVLSTPRFNVNDANGHIGELLFCDTARLALSASGIYAGLDLTGIAVGTGDGVKNEFYLPSRNARQSSIVIKKDGAIEAGVTKTLVTKTAYKSSQALTVPTDNIRAAGLSDDGQACVMSNNVSLYVYIYDFDGALWTQRPNLPNLPSGNCYASISGDGNVVAVAYPVSPYLMVFDWDGAAWTKRADPVSLPPAACIFSSLSQDGSTVAVVHQLTSPYITVYDWVAGAWAKRANPGTLPDQYTTKCHLTPDGAKLLCVSVHGNSVRWDMQVWGGASWTKRTGASVSQLADAVCSSDGSVVLAGSGGGGSPLVYAWSGAAYNVRNTLSGYGGYGTGSIALSQDGLTIITVKSSAPYIVVLRYIGSTWVEDTSVIYGSTEGASAILMAVDLRNILYSGGGTAMRTYVGTPKDTKITFDTPPAAGAVITADYAIDGIHKTTTRVIDLTFTIQFGEPA